MLWQFTTLVHTLTMSDRDSSAVTAASPALGDGSAPGAAAVGAGAPGPSPTPTPASPMEEDLDALARRLLAAIDAVAPGARADAFRAAIGAIRGGAGSLPPPSRDPAFLALARGVASRRDRPRAAPTAPSPKVTSAKRPAPARKSSAAKAPRGFDAAASLRRGRRQLIDFLDGLHAPSRCPDAALAGWDVLIAPGERVCKYVAPTPSRRVLRSRPEVARALGPARNPDRIRDTVRRERPGTNPQGDYISLSSVVENLGSEDGRSKNRGKRVRLDGGREF